MLTFRSRSCVVLGLIALLLAGCESGGTARPNSTERVYSNQDVDVGPRPMRNTTMTYLGRPPGGEAELEFTVGSDGRPYDIVALHSTSPAAAEYATERVRSNRYAPALIDNKPVACRMKMGFRFGMGPRPSGGAPFGRTQSSGNDVPPPPEP